MKQVKLIVRKEATSLDDFPSFSNGMIMATLQICGQSARWNDIMNMESSSWRAKGPSDVGGMSSEAAAPLRFTF